MVFDRPCEHTDLAGSAETLLARIRDVWEFTSNGRQRGLIGSDLDGLAGLLQRHGKPMAIDDYRWRESLAVQ